MEVATTGAFDAAVVVGAVFVVAAATAGAEAGTVTAAFAGDGAGAGAACLLSKREERKDEEVSFFLFSSPCFFSSFDCAIQFLRQAHVLILVRKETRKLQKLTC